MLSATPIEGAISYAFLLQPSRGETVEVTSSYPTVSMSGLLPDTTYSATVTAVTETQHITSAPRLLRTPALR